MKTGDNVTYMRISGNCNRQRFTTMEGNIVNYGPSFCWIKLRNGRRIQVNTERLRLASDESELTQTIKAMSERNK